MPKFDRYLASIRGSGREWYEERIKPGLPDALWYLFATREVFTWPNDLPHRLAIEGFIHGCFCDYLGDVGHQDLMFDVCGGNKPCRMDLGLLQISVFEIDRSPEPSHLDAKYPQRNLIDTLRFDETGFLGREGT